MGDESYYILLAKAEALEQENWKLKCEIHNLKEELNIRRKEFLCAVTLDGITKLSKSKDKD